MLPRTMTDCAVAVGREQELDRTIVHYMQTHEPYIGVDINPESVFNELRRWGTIPGRRLGDVFGDASDRAGRRQGAVRKHRCRARCEHCRPRRSVWRVDILLTQHWISPPSSTPGVVGRVHSDGRTNVRAQRRAPILSEWTGRRASGTVRLPVVPCRPTGGGPVRLVMNMMIVEHLYDGDADKDLS